MLFQETQTETDLELFCGLVHNKQIDRSMKCEVTVICSMLHTLWPTDMLLLALYYKQRERAPNPPSV